ncbi:hypothetical protein K7A41_07730 [Sphingobacterium sp. InxBP1]|uniref:hypothetical protein n=1 Tax=Sphingobacterium sp. InxBP1 TaxID=2870328 RepID=UPI002244F254|nr:hypothetical protein [Sphingobacterium sp. InxBP1]MCW8311108.1 hypothetical protein [Sphingobacterium sp. InxBP1]
MKKLILFLAMCWLGYGHTTKAQNTNDYFETTVTFPADFKLGDFIEFATAKPTAAGASGYYEISIAYTRGNIAAAATHIASSTHANTSRWQEAGRVNNNVYTVGGVNFTVDHNPNTKAFRIRAINTLGISTELNVLVKIRSINFNTGFVKYTTPISGNETNEVKMLPMTYDWDLIVGNSFTSPEGNVAIKATANGYIGIGTAKPTERLSVNGKIRAQEIKVEASPWPDYVFEEDHPLMPLDELEHFVKNNKHLPNIAPAQAVQENGVALGELNRQLLQKVEEMTLYLIQQNKEIKALKDEVAALKLGKN